MREAAEAPLDPGLAGEEHVRLLTGFADLFCAIVLITGAVALGGVLGSGLGPLAGAVLSGLAWWLAGPLVEKRRFAASAIALAWIFAVGLFALTGWALGGFGVVPAAVGSWIFWGRFKVPMAAALAMLMPIFVVGGLTGHLVDSFAFPTLRSSVPAEALFWGIVVFAVAMYWDLSDPKRQTRRADVAFWLHLAAAPLIVHGAFALFGLGWDEGHGQLGPVLVLFLLLALVALVIDRRPILVSSLSYLLYAMASAVDKESALGGSAAVALILGGGILVLSVAWGAIRSGLLRLVPTDIAGRLAPPSHPERPVPEPVRPEAEHEPVRLVFGFNDIFVSIGLVVLTVGSVLVSIWLFYQPPDLPGPGSGAWSTYQPDPDAGRRQGDAAIALLLDWRFYLPPLAAIWGAAEFFVRYRRMALPGVVLAFVFALFTAFAAVAVVQWVYLPAGFLSELLDGGSSRSGAQAMWEIYRELRPVRWIGAGFVAAANLLFAWRMKLPISVALGLLALLVPGLEEIAFRSADGGTALDGQAMLRTLLLSFGAVNIAIALALDFSDRARQTLRSDVAFWLYLSGSLFAVSVLYSQVEFMAWPLAMGAGLFLGILAGAILIDRRAPLLVALAPTTALFVKAGVSGPAVTLALCAALVACTLWWERIRAAVFDFVRDEDGALPA